MDKSLIITEKPSVARQFAAALGVSGNQDGYIEDDRWVITWCIGHLVSLSYPEAYDPALKKWSMDTLPFLPESYRYEVLKKTAKQYKIVKELLNRRDIAVIYNAGDSGREGEYIQRLVYRMAGVEGKKQIRRVWIDSQTDAEIKRGICDAKPASAYDALSDAAYERAIADFAVGINLSRALSCKYGSAFNKRIESSKYIPLAVGRVMTCVHPGSSTAVSVTLSDSTGRQSKTPGILKVESSTTKAACEREKQRMLWPQSFSGIRSSQSRSLSEKPKSSRPRLCSIWRSCRRSVQSALSFPRHRH